MPTAVAAIASIVTKVQPEMPSRQIPAAVAVAVANVLSGSHASLETLFRRCGVPGDPPDLSHATKWKTWLLQSNDHPDVDRLRILGRLLEEFMEVDQPVETFDERAAARTGVEQVLAKYGLRYRNGGRVIEVAAGPASESLREALASRRFQALEVEFERATKLLQEDPPAAVTAACSLLEALFRAFLDSEGTPLPDKQTIKPLWAAVQKGLKLDPKDQSDQDVQRVLSGLGSVVDGIGAFRTHAGSAHGGGTYRYRVQARHARLVVNSAHTLASFVIETWDSRQPGRAL